MRGVAGCPKGIDVFMLSQQEDIRDLAKNPLPEELLLIRPACPVRCPAKVNNREGAVAKGRASM